MQLNLNLLYVGTISHLSDVQKPTTFDSISCYSYREMGTLIHSWLKYKGLPILTQGGTTEIALATLQTQSSDSTVTYLENFPTYLHPTK